MTRTFVHTTDGHSKFWTVSVAGRHVHFTWGRIGTCGQQKTKSFSYESAARAAAYDKMQEKLGKGYVEIGRAA